MVVFEAMHEQSSGLDFKTLIEANVSVPIAFKDLVSLKSWSESNNLSISEIDDDNDKIGLIISGDISSGQDKLSYRQIWVDINNDKYREQLIITASNVFGKRLTFNGRDADHAVGRSRIKAAWPNAWINLVFVERGINRSVGSMLERSILTPTEDYVTLNSEAILKMFFEKTERLSVINICSYLKEARNAFIVADDTISRFKIGEISLAHAKWEINMHNNATAFFEKISEKYDCENCFPELIDSFSL
ncbi:hypothetical protein [Novacetimonas cocois]|uniref:hypothetical protein n=1 Tax=Novacetimonas cocois TaxID=1747507 RepID=UPI001058170F|nr:hypothetical protein [Novacetimonas cocois]